ncbi:MAG: M17 family peptidase N-terminal domain-containing protein, partial [Blastocatellia bacterium]
MKIAANPANLVEINQDVLIVPVFEGEDPRDPEKASALAALDQLTRGAVASVFEDGEMAGKRDSWLLLNNLGTLSTRRLLLYGAGDAEKIDPLSVRRLSGAAIRAVNKHRSIRSAAFLITRKLQTEAYVQAVVEGALIGQMGGELYRTNGEKTIEIATLDLCGELPDSFDLAPAIKAGTAMAESTNFARTLGYEPGNVMTPTELALRAQKIAEQ